MLGLIGRKVGMTRIFMDGGEAVPVTVIEVEPNRITQIRTPDVDGYHGVQVTIGERRASRVTKAAAGHFAKAGTGAGRGIWEFRVDEAQDGLEAGGSLTVERFEEGTKVDVRGRTIGKGFAGTIKRHHFRGQDNTHGNSLSHRVPGSIGQNQTPGRVFKGKKMSGHMGNVNRCQQNLDLLRVDTERNLLLVRGAVPGPAGGDVVVTPAVKQRT